MKLCEDNEMTEEILRWGARSKARDAHGGSLVARLKFRSFRFMVFNKLYKIPLAYSPSLKYRKPQSS